MEFDGDVLEFNIYESMKYPTDDHSCYSIDIIDSYSQDNFDVEGKDDLQVTIEHDLRGDEIEFVLSANLQEIVQDLEEHFRLPIVPPHEEPVTLTVPREKLVSSVLQAPKTELKELPSDLKYVFLGKGETLPVIISSKLTKEQE